MADQVRALRRTLLVGAIAALLITGCGSTTESADTGIPAQDAELVAEGAILYETDCAECHGSDLRGTGQGPSFLSKLYEPGHHADIAFLLAVRRGTSAHHWTFGDMAPIPGVSEEDVAAIVAFVRKTQRIEGFEPYPP